MREVAPFLMFEGQAEEAMNFYVATVPNSEIRSISRYGEGQPGKPGSVKLATFSLNGLLVMCIDSPVNHGFSFTPAVSLHLACTSEEEIDTLFAALAAGGQVLMPLQPYPFSKKYAWLNDRFGVSWQLNLVGS